jgi:catechol 2,3-dioxygenase-like lactoylglutathione lyase family enzyme
VIAFDHINIRSTDLEATRDFLVRLLGLVDGYRPPFDFPGHWLYLGNTPIIHTSGLTTPNPHGWVDHIAFAGFDFETEKARLEREGFSYVEAGIPGTGIRQLFVNGPDGLKVELQCGETA